MRSNFSSDADPMSFVMSYSARERAKDRVIAAYRENILLPEVALADRFAPEEIPPALGEDGEELTYERRVELMQKAGVKPMIDENGKRVKQDYVALTTGVVKSEQLGASSTKFRRPVRLVQARDAELILHIPCLDVPTEIATSVPSKLTVTD